MYKFNHSNFLIAKNKNSKYKIAANITETHYKNTNLLETQRRGPYNNANYCHNANKLGEVGDLFC